MEIVPRSDLEFRGNREVSVQNQIQIKNVTKRKSFAPIFETEFSFFVGSVSILKKYFLSQYFYWKCNLKKFCKSELFVKIRTTGPSFYIVKPNGIKIKPGELSIFEITLRKRSESFYNCSDKIPFANTYNCSYINNQKKLFEDRTCAINWADTSSKSKLSRPNQIHWNQKQYINTSSSLLSFVMVPMVKCFELKTFQKTSKRFLFNPIYLTFICGWVYWLYC